MVSEKVNGVLVHGTENRKDLMDYAMENKSILVAINAEKILHATEETRSIINQNLGYPDGMGAVWALKKRGHKKVEKIPGCELWLDIIKYYHPNKKFYLIGGKQEVIDNVVTKLKKEFPTIEISNHRNGYFTTNQEKEETINDIVKHQPDIVFVAMGSPMQEKFMSQLRKRHKALYQGLGGSFDVYVGNVKRAPAWWVKNNLEWAYRLLKQPRRITRQIYLIKFMLDLLFKY